MMSWSLDVISTQDCVVLIQLQFKDLNLKQSLLLFKQANNFKIGLEMVKD